MPPSVSSANRIIMNGQKWNIIATTTKNNDEMQTDENSPTEKPVFALPVRFKQAELSVWNEFMALDMKYKSVNLGQGKPNFSPPDYILQTLTDAANTNDMLHQYSDIRGLPRLRNILCRLYGRELHRSLNPDTEILITCGAYEALYCSISGLVGDGDEVIIIEPFFDCYEPMTLVAGGVVRSIPLRRTGSGLSSSDWKLDENELRALFNEKTKIIIVNSPMNPIGKIFSEVELKLIADLCIEFNVVCIMDEVYEWLIYEGAGRIRMATLPGMWERTITVCSAGKSLWVTGWKCGWAIGPEFLINRMVLVHRRIVEYYITPIQEAVAKCFEREFARIESADCWLKVVSGIALRKRDLFVKQLQEVGLEPIIPEGGFFILVDWSKLGKRLDLSSEDSPYQDFRFAKWMIKNIGLSSIPPTAFYSTKHKHIGEYLIRFCFIKTDETLNESADCLRKMKSFLR